MSKERIYRPPGPGRTSCGRDVALLLDTICRRRSGDRAAGRRLRGQRLHRDRESGASTRPRTAATRNRGGLFANTTMSRAIHVMEDWKHHLAETIVRKEDIPFSIVAPFRVRHEFFSPHGTVRHAVLGQGRHHGHAAQRRVSSTTRSPASPGSAACQCSARRPTPRCRARKYRYADIEAPVREAASVYFDYGLSKYANPQGHSSTIIDFRDFRVIRVGVVFGRVAAAFLKHGKVTHFKT